MTMIRGWQAWTAGEDDFIRRNPGMPFGDLVRKLGRSASSVKNRIHFLGVQRTTFRRWTAAEDARLAARYPNERNADIAPEFDCKPEEVFRRARRLGLKKSPAFLASEASGRMRPGQISEAARKSQFKKGSVPANKGLRRPGYAPGRMAETMFRKGHMAGAARHNYVPIGTLTVKDGVLWRKTTDDPNLYPARRWTPVARLVWEAAHGPIPPGYVVRFKDGMKTTVADEITPDRLECISKSEHGARNVFWNKYPREVAELIQLKGRLTRQINKRTRSAT